METLRLPRDLSHHPLVQVLFNMHESHREALRLPDGLVLRLQSIPLYQAKFDLTLYVEESARGLSLTASFDADLFDPARIDGFLEQYTNLLEQVLRGPCAADSSIQPGHRYSSESSRRSGSAVAWPMAWLRPGAVFRSCPSQAYTSLRWSARKGAGLTGSWSPRVINLPTGCAIREFKIKRSWRFTVRVCAGLAGRFSVF